MELIINLIGVVVCWYLSVGVCLLIDWIIGKFENQEWECIECSHITITLRNEKPIRCRCGRTKMGNYIKL